jgi:hypothetical protein
MPNHLHSLISFCNTGKNINTIIGNGKLCRMEFQRYGFLVAFIKTIINLAIYLIKLTTHYLNAGRNLYWRLYGKLQMNKFRCYSNKRFLCTLS